MSSPGGLSMYVFVSKPALVASTSIFCGLAILCNLFMILVILLSRLRSSWKHLIILALCIVGLYDACAVTAFFAQYYSLEQWIHDMSYFRYLSFSQFYILSSIRVLLLITICGLAIVNMFVGNKRFLTLMSISMIFASVFYSLVLVLPWRLLERDITSDCFFETGRVINSTAIFAAATILFVLIIDICIISCCCTRSFDDVTSAGERRIPIDVMVASAAFLVYTIPYQIVVSYFSSCSEKEECRIMFLSIVATFQWLLVGQFVLPLIWLLCPDVRREISRICGRNRSPTPQVNNVNYDMQFTDIKETQSMVIGSHMSNF